MTTAIRHFDSVVQNALLQEKLRFATTIVVLRMKAATWNVNSLKARMPRGLEFLDQHRPALLCLQETKTEGADFPHLELQAAGHQGIEHSAGRWAAWQSWPPRAARSRRCGAGCPASPPPRRRATWGHSRQRLAERLAACGIDRDFRKGPKPSDHAPPLVELD